MRKTKFQFRDGHEPEKWGQFIVVCGSLTSTNQYEFPELLEDMNHKLVHFYSDIQKPQNATHHHPETPKSQRSFLCFSSMPPPSLVKLGFQTIELYTLKVGPLGMCPLAVCLGEIPVVFHAREPETGCCSSGGGLERNNALSPSSMTMPCWQSELSQSLICGQWGGWGGRYRLSDKESNMLPEI